MTTNENCMTSFTFNSTAQKRRYYRWIEMVVLDEMVAVPAREAEVVISPKRSRKVQRYYDLDLYK